METIDRLAARKLRIRENILGLVKVFFEPSGGKVLYGKKHFVAKIKLENIVEILADSNDADPNLRSFIDGSSFAADMKIMTLLDNLIAQTDEGNLEENLSGIENELSNPHTEVQEDKSYISGSKPLTVTLNDAKKTHITYERIDFSSRTSSPNFEAGDDCVGGTVTVGRSQYLITNFFTVTAFATFYNAKEIETGRAMMIKRTRLSLGIDGDASGNIFTQNGRVEVDRFAYTSDVYQDRVLREAGCQLLLPIEALGYGFRTHGDESYYYEVMLREYYPGIDMDDLGRKITDMIHGDAGDPSSVGSEKALYGLAASLLALHDWFTFQADCFKAGIINPDLKPDAYKVKMDDWAFDGSNTNIGVLESEWKSVFIDLNLTKKPTIPDKFLGLAKHGQELSYQKRFRLMSERIFERIAGDLEYFGRGGEVSTLLKDFEDLVGEMKKWEDQSRNQSASLYVRELRLQMFNICYKLNILAEKVGITRRFSYPFADAVIGISGNVALAANSSSQIAQ